MTAPDLLAVQKALLDLHNWTVGVRGGWTDPTDDVRHREVTAEFGKADAILRGWLAEAGL